MGWRIKNFPNKCLQIKDMEEVGGQGLEWALGTPCPAVSHQALKYVRPTQPGESLRSAIGTDCRKLVIYTSLTSSSLRYHRCQMTLSNCKTFSFIGSESPSLSPAACPLPCSLTFLSFPCGTQSQSPLYLDFHGPFL